MDAGPATGAWARRDEWEEPMREFPDRCTLRVSSIPKGLRNKAQGCEERATLGKGTDDSQPQRGCGRVLFPWSSATTLSGLSPVWRAFSQGSSFLATLGFVAESLWDSALGATYSKMRARSSGLPALSFTRHRARP